MTIIVAALRFELLLLLAAIAFIVFFKIATGEIVVRGLLTDKVSGEFSLARLQLLVVTLGGVGAYAAIFFEDPTGAFARGGLLDEVSEGIAWVTGAGQATYLGAKSAVHTRARGSPAQR